MTRAMPGELFTWRGSGTGQPLCPGCPGGYLHPYKVSIHLPGPYGWEGADYLTGWVAVCVGNSEYLRAHPDTDVAPLASCGFSMALTPHHGPNR